MRYIGIQFWNLEVEGTQFGVEDIEDVAAYVYIVILCYTMMNLETESTIFFTLENKRI